MPIQAKRLLPASLLAALLGAGLLLGSGCAKQQECEQAINTINTAATRLEKLANDVDGSDMKKTADASTELAKAAKEEADKLAKLKVTTEELKGDYEAYTKMVNDAAVAADKLAKAARDANDLLSKLESSEKSINKVMENIKSVCAKGAPDCAAVGEVLLKAPTETDDKKLAGAMRAWVAEMGKLTPKDPDVKKALDEVMKVVTAQADMMDKAMKVQADAEAAAKELDAAVAPEDKLIDAMNKTCGAS